MITLEDLKKEVKKVEGYKDIEDIDFVHIEFNINLINSEMIKELIEKEILTDTLIYENVDEIETVETKECDNLLEIIENGYTKEVFGDKHKLYDRMIINLNDTIVEYAREQIEE